ncbi:hypothetical protein GGI1_14381 [Acidithiobacillus sp. GGI-221]|nr:hypothetical protein GGI1_14381 [Acidithiobacillus sp. GGI-221]
MIFVLVEKGEDSRVIIPKIGGGRAGIRGERVKIKDWADRWKLHLDWRRFLSGRRHCTHV